MNLFGKRTDVNVGSLLEQIETTSRKLAEVQGQLEARKEELDLSEQVETLKQERDDLTRQINTAREDHERQNRETEHKLGLHRQQVESERTIMKAEAEAESLRAVEAAKLAVREENLTAERERFEKEIEFRTQRFEEEAKTLRDLTGQILSRLPTVNVERSYVTTEHVGDVPALPPGEPKES